MNWTTRGNGTWEKVDETSFKQLDIEKEINGEKKAVFHQYTEINFSNYKFSCNVKFLEIGKQPNGQQWGEAKLIFTDADNSEKFRLDFMDVSPIKTCCLTYFGFQQNFPLEVTKEGGINIEFFLRSVISSAGGRKILISLIVDGNDVFTNFEIKKEFNKHIGIGTYLAKVQFNNIKIEKLPSKKCFVVMPFNSRRDYMYENAIVKALEEKDSFTFEKPYRLDKSLKSGSIPKELQEKINVADLIIADISEKNLNVFYEIGYSYALEKITLLLREDGSNFNIPFDIVGDRYVKYKLPMKQEDLDQEMKILKDKINNFIKTNVLE